MSFEILTVDRTVLVRAHAAPGSEFEDNLNIVLAERLRLDAIVTRDEAGYRLAAVPVLTPAALLPRIATG